MPEENPRARQFVWQKGDYHVVEPNAEAPTQPPHGAERRQAASDHSHAPIPAANALGAIRRCQHITQAQLAARLHVDQGRVSRLEHREDPLLSSVVTYLTALGARNVSITAELEDGTPIKVIIEVPAGLDRNILGLQADPRPRERE